MGAKFRELTQNFLKLADWAVHWQITLPGSTEGGNFQTGKISFAQPCMCHRVMGTISDKLCITNL